MSVVKCYTDCPPVLEQYLLVVYDPHFISRIARNWWYYYYHYLLHTGLYCVFLFLGVRRYCAFLSLSYSFFALYNGHVHFVINIMDSLSLVQHPSISLISEISTHVFSAPSVSFYFLFIYSSYLNLL